MSLATNSQPELLADSGLAELLRVSVRTVQRLAKRADFPRPIMVGRYRRWPKDEVLNYLRNGKCGAEGKMAEVVKTIE